MNDISQKVFPDDWKVELRKEIIRSLIIGAEKGWFIGEDFPENPVKKKPCGTECATGLLLLNTKLSAKFGNDLLVFSLGKNPTLPKITTPVVKTQIFPHGLFTWVIHRRSSTLGVVLPIWKEIKHFLDLLFIDDPQKSDNPGMAVAIPGSQGDNI